MVIGTRWSELDLIGRLLDDQETGDTWEVIHMPALFNDPNTGEETTLWPEMYPLETIRATRKIQGIRTFQALYQGKPAPEEGALFKKHWLRDASHIPNFTIPELYQLRRDTTSKTLGGYHSNRSVLKKHEQHH